MLIAAQITYVFTALQVESNSTNIAPDPWSFPFSLAAAIGSLATFAGFIVLLWQSRLTRTQISQTQQEIDSTLRPWLGHTSYTLHEVTTDSKGQHKSWVMIRLKNYGRLPARLTKQVQLWKLTEIMEEDLAKQQEEPTTHIMLFPDQESTYERVEEEQSHITGTRSNEYYFGFLLWYDFTVGEGRKEGKYGFILKRVISNGGYEDYILNTLAG
jgi:hypothetical protein